MNVIYIQDFILIPRPSPSLKISKISVYKRKNSMRRPFDVAFEETTKLKPRIQSRPIGPCADADSGL